MSAKNQLLAIATEDKKEISPKDFNELSKFVYQQMGIHLPPTPKNFSLLTSRLAKVVRQENLSGISEFVSCVKGDKTGKWMPLLISAITTNTTHFYREPIHFKVLKDFIEGIQDQQEIRIWCAAASTGEEPYTILFTLFEALGDSQIRKIKFLATDIDKVVLRKCLKAVYRDELVESIPKSTLQKFFSKGEGGYQVQKRYRDMITFAPFNLNDESYPFKNKFDVVFCRNVLIYFEREDAAAVVEKIVQHLRKGGALFFGLSEAGLGRNPNLEMISQSAFKRV